MGNRPSIEVWSRDPRTDWIEELQAGAEEAGVWMRAPQADTGDAGALAQGASRASPLGVGVGVYGGQAMIWVEALHRFNPLLHIEIKTRDQARQLGADAARYVKGTPLKAGE